MAGTAAFGAATRAWKVVGPGHFKVVWLVVAGLAVATSFGYRPSLIVVAMSLATFASIYANLHLYAGIITAAVATAQVALIQPPFALAIAALLGTVTNAMLLGHWHLNQPKLGTKPIAGLVRAMWVALAAFLAGAALIYAGGQGVTALGAIVALSFGGFTAVLTAMVRHLVKTRSIMSATGILYLQVLLCFVCAFTGSLAALAA